MLLSGTFHVLAPRVLLAGAVALALLLGVAAAANTSWMRLFDAARGGDAIWLAIAEAPDRGAGLAATAVPAVITDVPPSAATGVPTAVAPLPALPALARWSLQGNPQPEGLGAADRQHLNAWVQYLQANPARRVVLTLDNRPGPDGMPPARRLAYVLRFLARGGIDPHRVQLLLLPPADPPEPIDLPPILEIGMPT